jgi:hypothetical protein
MGKPILRRNRVLVVSIAILVLASAGLFLLQRHTNSKRILTDLGTILSVECWHEGGNATDDAQWSLTLDAQGNGSLAKSRRPPIRVSVPKAIPELTKAIRACRLSELPSRVGYTTVDHSANSLRIRTTTLDKTITIDFVPAGDEDGRCAQELWGVIQRCAGDVLGDKDGSARAVK